jgi:hypothetical protein
VSGYERITGSPTSVPANGTGTATASCSSGKKVVGGGFTATGFDKDADIMDVTGNHPSSDTQWTASIALSSGSSNSATLTAYVICVGS